MPSADGALPDWTRAYGAHVCQGQIKQTCSDFVVTERQAFSCSGDGEHDFLWIEKTGANTTWVARALARHAGVAVRDIGYAGMKDRHAVTRQWFSVRRPTGEGTDWASFELDGVRILDTQRHQRKLKTGAHRGNAFQIAIRRVDKPAEAIAARLEIIGRHGVPNYFGTQRFGHAGRNLQLAGRLFSGARLKREQQGIALSAARSFLFNEILASRVADGSWNEALPGEAVNLDQTGSFFVADHIDTALRERLASLDVHPTGALWGKGKSACGPLLADRERAIVARHPELVLGLERAGMEMARRSLRLAVRELSWEVEVDTLWLRFSLGRGSYATAVLREIAGVTDD